MAHLGPAEPLPVLASLGGAQQDAVADHPAGLGADEVEAAQLLGASPGPDPAASAVAGGQDDPLADSDDRAGAGGLDRVELLDMAKGQGGGRPGGRV